MGQSVSSWCRDGAAPAGEIALHLRNGFTCQSERTAGSFDKQGAGRDLEVEKLLEGLPKELVEALRESETWPTLRCRTWLSQPSLRGLLLSLQRCNLREVAHRRTEIEDLEECTFALPHVVSWEELDCDHVVSAGQVFRLEEVEGTKSQQMRRLGLQAIKQGKVALVLLAGGANFRMGDGEGPVCCRRKMLGLPSGKSLLQILFERVRRIAALCTKLEAAHARGRAPMAAAQVAGGSPSGADGKKVIRPSIPVYIMTSALTHRWIVEHLEANNFFGLPSRDVFLFSQPVTPVLDLHGQLIPQSLGGEFAHAPGGPGQVLRALQASSLLEQMRDRGVDGMHILGTDNLLARVLDPIFIGFCRDLEVDCATKVVQRVDVAEDVEIFAVRQGKVSTNYADVEESAYGVEHSEVPAKVLQARNSAGDLGFGGLINASYMSLSFAEDVVGRPTRTHKVLRTVPFLDFQLEPLDPELEELAPVWPTVAQAPALPSNSKGPTPMGVPPGGWPPEKPSADFVCQRALQAAGMEVRTHCGAEPGLHQEAWRCDVHLDGDGPRAVVRVRQGSPGPTHLDNSLIGTSGAEIASSELAIRHQLKCSLVVPCRPNAIVLESSVLDYFAYTDRAVALQVDRNREYAPINASSGWHAPQSARRALHKLHSSWVQPAGVTLESAGNASAVLEISPLASYDGEGVPALLAERGLVESSVELPLHITGEGEQAYSSPSSSPGKQPGGDLAGGAWDDGPLAVDELDTKPFYLQEYPQRPPMSRSHAPRFPKGPPLKETSIIGTESEEVPGVLSSRTERLAQVKCCGDPVIVPKPVKVGLLSEK
mmetsp:Transcript_61266/g.134179  ORF Transcript_61266/g.134179 Transcript_61266/m.134179 type:complete len:824 (+) Transcript_61266:127-2598(+)